MANEITATALRILDFKISSEVKENKDQDELEILTVIKFATRTDPQVFIDILRGVAQNVPIDCTFKSHQLGLDLKTE